MYESPIELIVKEVSEKITEDFNNSLEQSLMYKVNKEYQINVDKNELIRALQYDRNQYERGYNDCDMEYKKKISQIQKVLELYIVGEDGDQFMCTEYGKGIKRALDILKG